MNIKFDFTFTPDDKRVWLWKIYMTVFVILVYGLTYYFFGSQEAAVLAVSLIMVLIFIMAIIAAKSFATVLTSVLIMIAVGIAVIAVSAGATALTAILIMIALGIVIESMIAFIKNHKISIASNIVSAILQFFLIWLGLYIAQHLQIYLSWV